MTNYNKEIWNEIIEIGKKKEPSSKGIANKFNQDDVNTIVATMDFFGATDVWLQQTYYDLTKPKYRLFDWLAMCLMSRNDDDRKQNEMALKVMVHSYLKVKGNIKDFIDDLRRSDYESDHSWKQVDIYGDK